MKVPGFPGRVAAFAVLLVISACAPLAVDRPPPGFTSSWGAAMVIPNDKVALSGDDLKQVTLRQTMRLSLGGSALRVLVSNIHGAEPLVLGAASVGRASAGSSGLTNTIKELRFNGQLAVTVAPGTEQVSDTLVWQAAQGDDVVVSMYLEAVPARQSAHVAAHSTHFIGRGDQSRRAVLEGARPLTSWFHVAAIEVVPDRPAAVLVAIGDSITDGSGSTRDQNERWTDFLVRRLQREGKSALGVINAGIGGNRMLRDDFGPHVLARFERDVLGRNGVTHALVLIGVNDLGRLHKGKSGTPEARQAMLADLQSGWRALVQRAHARGVCVIAGTLTPYGGSRLYQPAAHNEADRQMLNGWLRNAGIFDGVADFDAAVRDAVAPDRLQAVFDSGDQLHLSPAGYRQMAEAVPLDRLVACAQPAA